MDRMARVDFRDNMHNLYWNRERFHPFKRMSDEQMMVGKTEIVSAGLMVKAINSAEARGNFNQRLRPLQQSQNQATNQVFATLQRLDLGLPVPPGRLDSWERARKHFSDKIDKINKEREDAITRNLKVEMAIYCQQHGLA